MIFLGDLKLRVQFTKKGKMKYLSHTEYSRTLMLAGRRAGLPLVFTGKHRPRIKISLSPPLPVGMTSGGELMDFFLSEYVSPQQAARQLALSLPDGVEVVRCRLMGESARSVGKLIDTAVYRAALTGGATSKGDWSDAVEIFLSREVINFERVQPRRTRVVDIRPGTHRLELLESGRRLLMVLDDGVKGTVKPREVIKVLADLVGAPPDCWQDTPVHREGLFIRRGGRLVSPMDLARGKPAV